MNDQMQKSHFQSDSSVFQRYSVYKHCLLLILRIKQHFRTTIMKKNQIQSSQKIIKENSQQKIKQPKQRKQQIKTQKRTFSHQVLPNLMQEQKCTNLYNQLQILIKERNNQRQLKLNNPQQNDQIQIKYNKTKQTKSENNIEQQQKQKRTINNQITVKDLILISVNLVRSNLILVILFSFIGIFARFLIHIFLKELFRSFLDQNLTNGYIYAGIITFLCFIFNYFQGLQICFIAKASHKFRYGMIIFLINKIVDLPQFSIKKAQIGKITNLISNDLNSIQDKFHYIGKIFVVPIYIIALLILLIVQYGWVGVIGSLLMIFFTIVGLFFSKLNASTIQKINIFKDKRIQQMTQLIGGLKFIKIYAWEIAFQKIIKKIRQSESKLFSRFSLGKGGQIATGHSAALIIAFTMFILLQKWNKNQMSTHAIFQIIEILLFSRVQVIAFSFGMICLQEIIITLTRYANILNIQAQQMIILDNKSLNQQNKDKCQSQINGHKKQIQKGLINETQFVPKNKSEIIIYMKDCSIGWSKQNLIVLNINCEIKIGQFIAVAGKIGSGKSTFLNAILQQIPYYSGTLQIQSSTAYVEQQPIIFSMTIQQNIIFQKQFNQTLYNRVLQDSCLSFDLENFPNKDQTIVGERGITLSGGQKSRLSLARALYADANILILDDPFSAVDSRVGIQIFQKCIRNKNKNQTIILATHHIQYLQKCDHIFFLQEKKIKYEGSYAEIEKQLKTLSQNQMQDRSLEFNQQLKMMSKDQYKQQLKPFKGEEFKNLTNKKDEKFKVTIKSYLSYSFYNKKNYILLPLTLILYFTSEMICVFAYRYFAIYEQSKKSHLSLFNLPSQYYWLTIGMLTILYYFLNFIKYFLTYFFIQLSNQTLHDKMVEKLLKAPLSYFDNTPSGQIISKFSNDIGIMDNILNLSVVQFLICLTLSIILLSNVIQLKPIFIVPVAVMIILAVIIYIWLKEVIQKTREKDLQQKNPLFVKIAQTLNGMIQLKCYSNKTKIIQKFQQLIDNSARVNYSYWLVMIFFSQCVFYLNILCTAVVLFIGIPTVNKQTAGQLALVIVIILQVNGYFSNFVRQYSNMDSNLISFQRIRSIIDIKSQKPFETEYDAQKNLKKAQNLVSPFKQDFLFDKPTINIQNLSMKYSQNLPFVLKNLSIKIKSSEKIGVVGRTGAGKSSIIQSILRLTQPEKGSNYEIKDINALEMGLHTLRSNISVIPQKSFFFKDTIKKNLDPFDKFTEQEIWKALQNSNLNILVGNLQKKLQTSMNTVQEVFSIGQQQLMSLCRVLLSKNNILILDEATSSVDDVTDNFIQMKIKEHFQNAIVITIAHRLTTIACYDKVAVIDNGSILQFDHPYVLINKKGLFFQMVQQSGKKRDTIIQMAKQAYQQKIQKQK